jgi:hypothetical protein
LDQTKAAPAGYAGVERQRGGADTYIE